MRIRVHIPGLLVFLAFTFVLSTFTGLAGWISVFLAIFLPSLLIFSIIHLFLSWCSFGFHQNFSSDHPQKGEVVHYSLHVSNQSIIPIASGECRFSNPGPMQVFATSLATPVGPGETVSYETDIRCSYRGTYVVGLTSVAFTAIPGIVSIEERIDPRVFYVFPEIVKLDRGIERIARSSGADQPGTSARESDLSIFEYLSPIRAGHSAGRIAWKRWASSGIPAEIIPGQSRSAGLRLVLDLWPGTDGGLEKLASEDMAISAVFSILRSLSNREIPTELILGSNTNGIKISSPKEFSDLFDQSTNIIFSDPAFPAAAFTPGEPSLLITTRPLTGCDQFAQPDIFTSYEDAVLSGCEPHLLVCPPPGKADEERHILDVLIERQTAMGGHNLLRLADARRGTEELVNALCT